MDEDNQPTSTNPGKPKPVLHLVVHRSMNELVWLQEYLEESCYKYLGREHTPDEGCNRTHCHFAIHYKYTKQALAKKLTSNNINGSDNYGILSVCEKTKKPYDFELLAQYILKAMILIDGKPPDTIRYSGITQEDVDVLSEKSRNYEPNKRSKEGDDEKLSEWDRISKEGIEHFKTEYFSLQDVKRFVMWWYYRKTGRMPLAYVYKRNVLSLYMVLITRTNGVRSESIAIDEVIDAIW